MQMLRHGLPRRGLEKGVALWRTRNLPNLWRGAWRVLVARALRIPHHYGVLYLDLIKADGRRVSYGLASMRVVTNAGAGYVVDAFQNLVELEEMKYHGFGTGTNAEAAGDTSLQTELTTQYPTNSIRPTGTTTEASAQVYRTVATLDPDADVAITEHGVFSDVDQGQGVLLDRSVFSVVNVDDAGDTLQATYDFTINSGG